MHHGQNREKERQLSKKRKLNENRLEIKPFAKIRKKIYKFCDNKGNMQYAIIGLGGMDAPEPTNMFF